MFRRFSYRSSLVDVPIVIFVETFSYESAEGSAPFLDGELERHSTRRSAFLV